MHLNLMSLGLTFAQNLCTSIFSSNDELLECLSVNDDCELWQLSSKGHESCGKCYAAKWKEWLWNCFPEKKWEFKNREQTFSGHLFFFLFFSLWITIRIRKKTCFITHDMVSILASTDSGMTKTTKKKFIMLIVTSVGNCNEFPRSRAYCTKAFSSFTVI